MAFVVDNLQYYLQVDVLAVQWEALTRAADVTGLALPPLPPKRSHRSQGEKFALRRRGELDAYIEALVSASSSHGSQMVRSASATLPPAAPEAGAALLVLDLRRLRSSAYLRRRRQVSSRADSSVRDAA